MSVRIVISSKVDSGEDLVVPEEPTEDDDESRGEARTPLTFFTAAGIARWMARAYGYVAKKKASYLSQDLIRRRKGSDGLSEHVSLDKMRNATSMDLSPVTSRPGSAVTDPGYVCGPATKTGADNSDEQMGATVCRWVSCSYGRADGLEEYYAAYARKNRFASLKSKYDFISIIL